MLGGFGLSPHQAEHPVGQMGGAGPDLLAIDHPFLADQFTLGRQTGQVAAGVWLGIALTPQHFSPQGGANELRFLLFRAHFQQGGHQHGDPLPAHAR